MNYKRIGLALLIPLCFFSLVFNGIEYGANQTLLVGNANLVAYARDNNCGMFASSYTQQQFNDLIKDNNKLDLPNRITGSFILPQTTTKETTQNYTNTPNLANPNINNINPDLVITDIN